MSLVSRFEMGGRWVGPGDEPYVIAEAGANHNRDMMTAKELIDVAARAGADAVKFQTYSGNRIYSRKTPRFKYLEGVSEKSPADLLEEISLPRDWQEPLRDHAVERGIHFFSSVFDHDAIRELDALDVPALKIASFEIVDLPLIRAAAATGRPLIISTGMASLGDIEDALRAAEDGGATEVGLMQCTSVYPAPPERANLRAMETMRTAFGVPVGLSDHTTGTAVAVGAAAMGASFIEKHFTLDRSMVGPDHAFALEPADLTAMITGIREAFAALGDGQKCGPSPEERKEMYANARRSLVASRAIPHGTTIEREMVTVKRPGFGIAPKHLDIVIGRRAQTDIEEDDVITWDMV
jgi:N,N'-diacetyllegionaminate synthase